MNKCLSVTAMLVMALIVSGCSSLSSRPESRPVVVSDHNLTGAGDARQVRDRMYEQYQQWKGTKYALGGLSKDGIDCSGFVYVTYQEKLGIRLPRTTDHQSRVGREIDRSDLNSGDLVFFKTGVKVRHVGIYVGDGKFLHASTSKGVTISRLDNLYWKDKYWHSRRIGF